MFFSFDDAMIMTDVRILESDLVAMVVVSKSITSTRYLYANRTVITGLLTKRRGLRSMLSSEQGQRRCLPFSKDQNDERHLTAARSRLSVGE